MREPPDPVSLAQYNNVKTKNKQQTTNQNAMSRNPRVCPAQINVWCCAKEIGYIIVWASTDSSEA